MLRVNGCIVSLLLKHYMIGRAELNVSRDGLKPPCGVMFSLIPNSQFNHEGV